MALSNMAVKLVGAMDDCNSAKVYFMMNNEKGIQEIFAGRLDRLLSSEFSWLIVLDEEEVGFANLVREKSNYDFLFLDLGIKEKYRGKGIGTEVLRLLTEMPINNYVLLETKINNISANKINQKVGCLIDTIGEQNYYLLQTGRVKEFIDSNMMRKLGEHLNTSSLKKDLIKGYHN